MAALKIVGKYFKFYETAAFEAVAVVREFWCILIYNI